MCVFLVLDCDYILNLNNHPCLALLHTDKKGLGGLGLGWALAYWNQVVPALALPPEPRQSLRDIAIRALGHVLSDTPDGHDADSIDVAVAALATMAARPCREQVEEEVRCMLQALTHTVGILERPPGGLALNKFTILALSHISKIMEVLISTEGQDQDSQVCMYVCTDPRHTFDYPSVHEDLTCISVCCHTAWTDIPYRKDLQLFIHTTNSMASPSTCTSGSRATQEIGYCGFQACVARHVQPLFFPAEKGGME